jgi:hypothetical protein
VKSRVTVPGPGRSRPRAPVALADVLEPELGREALRAPGSPWFSVRHTGNASKRAHRLVLSTSAADPETPAPSSGRRPFFSAPLLVAAITRPFRWNRGWRRRPSSSRPQPAAASRGPRCRGAPARRRDVADEVESTDAVEAVADERQHEVVVGFRRGRPAPSLRSGGRASRPLPSAYYARPPEA